MFPTRANKVAPICPGRDVAFCSELSPTILEDSGDGFLAQDRL